MNLKPIVAAMVVSGVVSAPAFADTLTQVDSMRANTARMQAILDQNKSITGENLPDWFNRISIAGEMNIDGAIANRVPTQVNEVPDSADPASESDLERKGASDIFLNNVNLLVDAQVNDWVNTHVGFLYGQSSPSFLYYSAQEEHGGRFENGAKILDEAYVTIGNLARTPFYFRAGREFLPFGDYNRFAMTNMVQSMTQLLEQAQHTVAQVGFVDVSGFNGSVYGFRDLPTETSYTENPDRTHVNNWGLHLGFASLGCDENFSYKLGLDYLSNMTAIDYLATGAGTLTDSTYGSFYTNRVGGLAAYANLVYGQFDGTLDYVTALKGSQDLAYPDGAVDRDAKVAAWGIDLGYSFPTMNHQSRIGLGYQGSKDASNIGVASGSTNGIGLPKDRWLVNYVVNTSKCTDLGFEIYHDTGYGPNNTDLDKRQSSTAGVVRLGVRFS
jgi:hypothetical protein